MVNLATISELKIETQLIMCQPFVAFFNSLAFLHFYLHWHLTFSFI